MKQQDKEEFKAYLENISDSQVLGVLSKEKASSRKDYAAMAQAEAEKRGLV